MRPATAAMTGIPPTDLRPLLVGHAVPVLGIGLAHVPVMSAPAGMAEEEAEQEPGQQDEGKGGDEEGEEVKQRACDHAAEREFPERGPVVHGMCHTREDGPLRRSLRSTGKKGRSGLIHAWRPATLPP